MYKRQLTNGNGLTNGAGIGGYSRVPLVSTANRNATFAGVAAFTLIFAGLSIFLLWESDDGSAITIDGENDDWVGLTTYSDVDSLKVSNNNIDIVEVSYLMDSIYFSIYVGFEDPVFSSTSTNLIRILVDTDQDTSTGFYGPGIGADYYIEISGKAQSVITCLLYTSPSPRDCQ